MSPAPHHRCLVFLNNRPFWGGGGGEIKDNRLASGFCSAVLPHSLFWPLFKAIPRQGLKNQDAGVGETDRAFPPGTFQLSSPPSPNNADLCGDWKVIFNLGPRRQGTESLTTNTASGIPRWSRRPFPAAASKPHPSLAAAILGKPERK